MFFHTAPGNTSEASKTKTAIDTAMTGNLTALDVLRADSGGDRPFFREKRAWHTRCSMDGRQLTEPQKPSNHPGG